MGKIRICYVINAFGIGGAETVVLDLSRGLDPRRYDVQVLAVQEPRSRREPEMRRRFREAGVRTAALHLGRFRNPLSLLALWRWLRRGRFDIVHGHNRPTDAWAVLAGGWAGIPVRLWTRHLVYRDLTPGQARRYRALARSTPVVLAVSETVRRACIETEGIPPAKVVTMVNGIDTGRFAPLPEAVRAGKRAELGVRDDEQVLLFVGRLSPQKAPEAFVRLVWMLQERGMAVRGLVCGDGPLADRLAALVGEHARAVELLGFRSDVPALLGAADLFVSTSRNEGLPLNVMEAMATGLPIAAPAIPQIAGLVQTRPVPAGILYAPAPLEGEVPAELLTGWANAVGDLLSDPARTRELGDQGRRTIERDYSFETMVRRHDDLYRRLLDRNPSPGSGQ